jgi:predicted phage terminase large subunit-like protein
VIRADIIARIKGLPPDKRRELITGLPRALQEEILWDWRLFARPEQLPPDAAWKIWLILSGRGWGKTRTGAEWVRSVAAHNPNARIALVGRTVADIRDVMVRGESGILAVSPPSFRPRYEPSKRTLVWPNGAQAYTYGAEVPDLLRGPQHHAAWCDELAAWSYPEAWDQLQYGLRLGEHPQTLITTTPRPTKLIRQLVTEAKSPASGVVLTRGRTHDNRANLPAQFLAEIERRYAGTRLYRQEVEGDVLEDIQGALWRQGPDIHDHRVSAAPQLVRIVIGVDPAVTTHEDSDLTGIIVCGIDHRRHGYVLEDISGRYSPAEWAREVVNAYNRHHADRVVVERNQGGDLVTQNLRAVSAFLPITTVHAAKGKFSRAEPVATLYQRGLVHHVGVHDALELEMTSYSPQTARRSPDRMDALVYALTDLLLGEQVFRSPGSFVV